MMADSYEDDVRMLDEVVSDGRSGSGFVPGPRVTRPPKSSRFDPSEAISDERLAELNLATTSELQVLLHRRASALRVDELKIIHDLVAERTPLTCDELSVMRATMRELVTRLKK